MHTSNHLNKDYSQTTMYLERIELQGFKSFAERTILEFLKPKDNKNSITIIVGPNGAGKSNISDAVKWVLGEQSMKIIRGKTSEDVIFSGSEKRSRLGFAEVSLYLNNEDKTVDIEYPQIVITRRLYRDGQSEYLLNKNPVRLFDINMLLAKAHFGQKSFSIISQGRIDSVLLATPMERKEFFDEAVGVKEHQIKRHQALNKLERTEVNLHQANLLLKEIGPQLRSLTRQVKKLEQREKIQHQLRDYQQEYYHRIYKELTTTKTSQNSSISLLQKEIDEQQKKLSSKRSDLEIIERGEKRSQAFSELQKKLEAKNLEKNTLLREMTIIKGRLEIDLEKQGKLDLAWLYRKEEEVSQRIIEVQKEIENTKHEHKKITAHQKEKVERLNTLKQQVQKHNETIDNLKSDIQHETSRGPLTILGRRLKELYIQFQKFSKKLVKATPEELEKLTDEAESLQAQINELSDFVTNEIDSSQKETDVQVSESQELWSLQQELTAFLENHDRLAPEIAQSQIKTQVLEEKIRLQEKDHDQLQHELKRITDDLSVQKAAQEGKVDTKKIEDQRSQIDREIKRLDEELAKLKEKIQAFNEEEDTKQSRVFQLEREYQEVQQQVNRLLQKQHSIQVELARTETKLEDVETEIRRELGEVTVVHERPDQTDTDLESLPTDHLFSNIEKFKYQLELIGGIDPETVEEYKQVKERYDFLDHQTNDLEESLGHLEKIIQELDKTIVSQFDKAFSKINKEFERYFQILFGGGRAKLIKILPDDENKIEEPQPVPDGESEEGSEKMPVIEIQEEKEDIKKRSKKYRRSDIKGIDIYASPAGKKLSTIGMLSGGERSLTSLALIAAIIHNNPSPFVLMDEVDAALDEANSQRMAKVLENLRLHTQFIIITHNRTIMNIADTIYGVTMGGDGVSKLLSVKLEDVDQHATRL